MAIGPVLLNQNASLLQAWQAQLACRLSETLRTVYCRPHLSTAASLEQILSPSTHPAASCAAMLTAPLHSRCSLPSNTRLAITQLHVGSFPRLAPLNTGPCQHP